MKTKYFIYPLLMFSGLCACTPDEDELVDFSDFQIAKVELGADHRQLIADGISTITFNILCIRCFINRIKSRRMTGGTLSYTVKYRWTGLLKERCNIFWKTELR